ncbi:hypothetical protein BDV96DRAFT_209871 [Lophiotrema nucula]|uniref:Ubiquitin-like protease family profile domain-containing protein n=1 Tax=Lophiotrema nucula TaxID=690887 RepID=A0A6A5ZST1_9PLEO|nr:hypothetical protein BDV96DRAFT_209871 [Lophiotrema nucula]
MKRSAGDAGMDSYDMDQYAVPGAFPTDDPAAAEPASSSSSSVFTTVGIVVLSLLQWLRPTYWRRRILKTDQPQQHTIRAEPVSRDSVGRKKILIDAGLQHQHRSSPTKSSKASKQTIPLTPLNTFTIRGNYDETPTPQDFNNQHWLPNGSIKPLLRTPDTLLPRTPRPLLYTPEPRHYTAEPLLHTPEPLQAEGPLSELVASPVESHAYPQTWSEWMEGLPDAPSVSPSPSPPKKATVDDFLDTTLHGLATPSKQASPRDDHAATEDDDEGLEMSQLSNECADDFKDCVEEATKSPEAKQAALYNLRIKTPESVRVSPDSGRIIRGDAPPTPTERQIHSQQPTKQEPRLTLQKQLANQYLKKYAIKALFEQPPPPRPLLGDLTPDDQKIMKDAVQEWVDDGKKKDKKLGKVSAHDLGTILPVIFDGDKAAWLNDEIINSYLSVLVDHVNLAQGYVYKGRSVVAPPPAHVFSSQWYTTMTGPKPESTITWAKKRHVSGKNFFECKLLLFPICKGLHWRLVAVMPQQRRIEYLDSLTSNDKADALIMSTIHKFLKLILGNLYNKSEWNEHVGQRSQQQLNASDCGVFTLLNGLALLSDSQFTEVLVKNGMEAARLRIASTLIKGKVTGERI